MSRTVTIYEAKDLDLLPLDTEVWVLLGGFGLDPFTKWTKAPREGDLELVWRGRPRHKGMGQTLFLSTANLASFMPVLRVDAELLEITDERDL